ncbi:aldehyde dehydrogenase family protein [Sphingomonas sp. RP10(2022)]|uniref:Aldehyde dehydrogenase family protein n=1 Tax=Sphingomonas liriopis TaxID=2949094 RepID=A0A9X2KQM9_9SPHN|nr:aldehyde dehydrogenase family protein [Sphingomonas liriopis]MCP3735909.1 aldehyde dehydrogenase family protein [Sphingomonas liriopis]
METYANLVAGVWRSDADARPDTSPSDTSDTIGLFAAADADLVAEALAAAHAAQHGWARTTAAFRAAILSQASAELFRRAPELGELLAREEGKTRLDATGEVTRAAQVLQYFAGEAVRAIGEKYPQVRPDVDVDVTREPVGVVGIITPWNFPIAIPAWKIAAALAYGNTVVFKPADLTPASAWALVDILHRAGLPAGVLNLVMGRGSVVGDPLVDGVDAISFTGSVPTGRRIAARAIGRMTRLQLEMGGKNPFVVLDDADLDVAVACALNGAFFQTGQRCTASSRLIVTEGIHDAFVERLTAEMGKLRIGHALDAETQIGPVVDARQMATDLDYIRIARDEGCEVVGGEQLERATTGHFLSPALLVGATNAMRSSREEIFGPVASLIRVANYDEALAVANDTEFGLSSGICTTSLSRTRDFQRNSAAGLVMVNVPTAGLDYHVPFGGRKGSSYGPREQGSYAREFYTTVKTSYISG